jgi:hypothetical protein
MESNTNSHTDVVATTRMPAMFIAAQTTTIAKATRTPRCPTPKYGKSFAK